ncbi:MAG TPA: phage holin family protein [Gallionella sp.]|nr:phage holin family protein [Gallionella sp.]
MSHSSGLMESSKRMVGTLLAMVKTRIELLSNEMEEARLRFEQVLFYSSLVLFFFGLSIMLMTVFVVVLFWDSQRLQVLGGLAALFFVAGMLASMVLRRVVNERTKVFSASLDKLGEDINLLGPRS